MYVKVAGTRGAEMGVTSRTTEAAGAGVASLQSLPASCRKKTVQHSSGHNLNILRSW